MLTVALSLSKIVDRGGVGAVSMLMLRIAAGDAVQLHDHRLVGFDDRVVDDAVTSITAVCLPARIVTVPLSVV